jgi:hypothetical protein
VFQDLSLSFGLLQHRFSVPEPSKNIDMELDSTMADAAEVLQNGMDDAEEALIDSLVDHAQEL